MNGFEIYMSGLRRGIMFGKNPVKDEKGDTIYYHIKNDPELRKKFDVENPIEDMLKLCYMQYTQLIHSSLSASGFSKEDMINVVSGLISSGYIEKNTDMIISRDKRERKQPEIEFDPFLHGDHKDYIMDQLLFMNNNFEHLIKSSVDYINRWCAYKNLWNNLEKYGDKIVWERIPTSKKSGLVEKIKKCFE
jgi:hypothetical protein